MDYSCSTLDLSNYSKEINEENFKFILKEIEYSRLNKIKWPINQQKTNEHEIILKKIDDQLNKNSRIEITENQININVDNLKIAGNVFFYLNDYESALDSYNKVLALKNNLR